MNPCVSLDNRSRAESAVLANRPLDCPRMSVVSLTNGRYSVRLSGGGQRVTRNVAGERSRAGSDDETCDVDGFHIYLRDLDDDFVWSAGYQPTRVAGIALRISLDGGVAEIVRVDREHRVPRRGLRFAGTRFRSSPLHD